MTDRLTPETLMGLARLFPSRRTMPKTTMGLDAHVAQWRQDLARIAELEQAIAEALTLLHAALDKEGGPPKP